MLKEVEKTIRYARFFNTSLSLKDLHLWLISHRKHSPKEVSDLISKYPDLKKQIIFKSNVNKTKIVNKKIKKIQKLILAFKFIPTIKLVALTGSLAINNPKKQDDIDLMIVVSPNTLWLTRPIVVLLTILLSKRRRTFAGSNTNNQVCINLWLDRLSLEVPKAKQNLYTAHEVLQIKPLFDKGDIYQQFIASNLWTRNYLANAFAHYSSGIMKSTPKLSKQSLIGYINSLAFMIQYLYMKSKITTEYITLHSAYFHPRNLYLKIRDKLN